MDCWSRSAFPTAVSWNSIAPRFGEISHLGGTILGTTNRGNPFCRVLTQPDGRTQEVDCSDDLVQRFRQNGIEIAVGGDGSLTIADQLHRKGLCVVGVPKMIENDLESTAVTLGFNTAVSFATECIAMSAFDPDSGWTIVEQ